MKYQKKSKRERQQRCDLAFQLTETQMKKYGEITTDDDEK